MVDNGGALTDGRSSVEGCDGKEAEGAEVEFPGSGEGIDECVLGVPAGVEVECDVVDACDAGEPWSEVRGGDGAGGWIACALVVPGGGLGADDEELWSLTQLVSMASDIETVV